MWINKFVWSKLWRTDRHTDTRQTDTGIDKSLKTEGPKILSNDIFYFRTVTVIIGGPITMIDCRWILNYFFFHRSFLYCAVHMTTTISAVPLNVLSLQAMDVLILNCRRICCLLKLRLILVSNSSLSIKQRIFFTRIMLIISVFYLLPTLDILTFCVIY